MKKTIKLMLLLCCLFAGTLMAKPVSPVDAKRVAENFWKSIAEKVKPADFSEISGRTHFTELYLFISNDGKGFVVVSADDRALPVLGYSANSTIDLEHMPENAVAWLQDYEREIRYLKEHDVAPTEYVQQQWSRLMQDNAPQVIATVSPLLTTTWNQSPYYNDLCPYDSEYGERAVAGCVATATSQVMKYWNHPSVGVGSHSYVHPTYGTLSADFANTTYNWSQMPNNLSSSSSTAQKTAVATLCYHIGVAIEMDYGVSGSGAYTFEYGQGLPSAENALKTYFKYRNTLHGEFKQFYTDAQWMDMLRADLDLSHPVIYSGSDTSGGHCFVCDGYNNNNQFHFNWGWGGYCDGYYTIGSLNPNPGGTGGNATYTFNLANGAILGIEPDGALRVDPQSVSLPQAGGSATVHVSSSTSVSGSWTASASQSWVAVSPTTGSGSGAVTNLTISASANNTGATRTALVTINHGGQTATVNVAQSGCAAADMCNIMLVLNDSYGDGWNGASVTVQSLDGLDYGTYTLASGAEAYYFIPVCPEPVQFVWNTGAYDSECTFMVADASNSVVLSQSNPSDSGNYVVQTPCVSTSCDAISAFPYTMGFEPTDPISCWTFVDSDGDGYGWTNEFLVGDDYAHGGEYFMGSASYYNNVGALNPDDWMISPSIVVPAGGLTLSWYAAAQDASYPNEYYAVYVSTTGSSTTDFTTAVYQGIVEGATYTHKVVSLDAYAGQTIHIAFRHFNCSDEYWLKIDDVSLTAATGPSYTITTAVNDNTMGTVSGGGSYPQGTSITLTAIPNSTYRFVQWQDGNTSNPRTITVTGNATYTATFASIWGDTLYYDNDTYETSIGTQGEFYWGIKFEPNALSGRNSLTDVEFFIPGNGAGTYQLNIYQGGSSAPQTLACTQNQTYASADENAWKTIHLSSPLLLNSAQPLWITFHTTSIGYPASACDFTGDYNGSMLSLDGSSWSTVQAASDGELDYTWMIRAITSATVGNYVISVTSSNPTMGTVTGGGSYVGGATATLVATPNAGYHFVNWNDGNTDNPRIVTVTGNATYEATFFNNWGDTLYYDNGQYTQSIGTNDEFLWGIRFEPNELTGRNYLTNVEIYVPYEGAGSYQLFIFQGGTTAPQTEVAAQTAVFSDDAEVSWQTIHLNTPVAIDASQSLWVVFYTVSVAYPAAACYFTGDYNGSMLSLDGSSWSTVQAASEGELDYTWMIRAITSATAGDYVISATPADPSMGTVSGGGAYAAGATATLIATPFDGYHFVCWQDGNADNPRTIAVTGNATFIASFAQNAPITYTVTVVSANPEMGTVTGGGVYEAGATVTLTATPFDGYHFVRWNNGITSNPFVFAVSEDVTLSAEFAIDVAIDDVENVAVRIYPNPTSGVLNLEAEGLQKVELYDAVGRMVLMSQTNNSTSINLSSLAPGIYTIRLTLPQGVVVRKVVHK